MTERHDRTHMRPFEQLAPWAKAREVAVRMTVPIDEIETLALPVAAGRVLAQDANSRVDVPTADRAAMDGFAVRARDLSHGGQLRRTGRVSAGEEAKLGVEAGACVEIATGAPMPPGTDAVVPVERTGRDADQVIVRGAVAVGDHVALRAADLGAGRPVGRSGDRLTASLIAACAAGGIEQVSVWHRPRVLIAPTGDEIVPLGQGRSLRPGQVYDSNAAGLMALVREAGAEPVHAGIVLDDIELLIERLQEGGPDLVVTVGGTSVGRRDLVSDAVARVGETLVHGVAVRPGKPLLLGRVASRPMVGLPGYPTTCMMLGYALLDPLVRRMARRTDARPTRGARLAITVQSPPDKAQLLPVALADNRATPTFTVSSAVTSMALADGWIEIDTDVSRLEAESHVEVTLF